MGLPGWYKLKDRSPKHLLVRALRPGPPDCIVKREKQRFSFPFGYWLKQDLRMQMEDFFRNCDTGRDAEFFNPSALWDVWRQFLAGRTGWSRPRSLYVLNQWCCQPL
jgi:hypothetical protein